MAGNTPVLYTTAEAERFPHFSAYLDHAAKYAKRVEFENCRMVEFAFMEIIEARTPGRWWPSSRTRVESRY
jgi:hypothetical protein